MEIVLFWLVLALAFGPWLIRLLVAPLIVYRTHGMPVRYELAPQALAPFLAARGAEFISRHAQLLALGYEPAVASGYSLSHTEVSLLLYRNEVDTSLVTQIESSGPGMGRVVATEFARIHADGTLVALNDGPLPSTFPRWSRRQGYRLPRLHAPAALRERFLAICARSARTDATLPPRGHELAALQDFMNDELQALADAGFVRGHEGEAAAKLSLLGAYRACWILSWPLKPLLNARDARRAAVASTLAWPSG